jgi:hypothetical protein
VKHLAGAALGIGIALAMAVASRSAPRELEPAPRQSMRPQAHGWHSVGIPPITTPVPLLLCYAPAAQGDKDGPKGKSAERPYLGFRTCIRCHNSGPQGVSVALPGGGTLDLKDDSWVLYKEYPIWAEKDKHGQAYTVLLNERSKQIGKALGVSEIHRDRRCLACHTGFPISQMPLDKDHLVDKELPKSLDVNLGVSCEGCHGPGGDRKEGDRITLKGWMNPHQIQPVPPFDQNKPWRFLSPQTKRDDFGFVDVRSPVSRTRLCASCHIGNVEQGRIVTHEMYAAGHPPLPGFELETFTQQMPRHWEEFAAKSDKVRAQFLQFTKDAIYQGKRFEKANLHRTKSLLVGGLVSASEYLRLAGQLAAPETKSLVPRPDWPEFAAFDCYACHHELKSPAWRQMRPAPPGIPGRPPLQEWHLVLARIALKTLGDADFDAKLAEVRQAIGRTPFGTREEMAKATSPAADWLLAAGDKLQLRSITLDEGAKILKEIAAAASSQVLDYDSARQLTWAFKVVHGEMGKTQNSDAIATQIEPLNKMFLLDLRSGRKAATTVPGEAKERQTIEVDLGIVLPLIASYEPGRFQERFREITKLLQ